MHILVVDNGSTYLSALKRLLSPHSFEIVSYDSLRANLDHPPLTQYDLTILSGGHAFSVVGNEDKSKPEIDLILTSKTPLLGICLGFELIAAAFGARLIHLPLKQKGLTRLTPVTSSPLFDNLTHLDVYESHRWVVKNPGSELLALARSVSGIEIIRHNNKLIYGFQFHPEMFPDQSQGDEMFANFLRIVENSTI